MGRRERMTEMAMLGVARVDLSMLCTALEDHSHEASWWLDPETGAVELFSEELDEHPDDRGLVPVDPIPSHEAYRDLEDFVARVREPRARDLLERAIAGRGAFRRFKDTLHEFPELREAWFAFHDARMERRAIRWLEAEGLVSSEEADRQVAAREDPDVPALGERFDPYEVAEEVARDLKALYGDRLIDVVLFGSWARGDAHPDSDIDLVVVLDRVTSRWEERRRMDAVLWRHSYRNGTIVSALPVGAVEFERGRVPVLARAKAEGRSVA